MKRKSRRPWLSQSCSSLNIRTKVHQALFCSKVYIKTLLVADMNTLDWLEAFHSDRYLMYAGLIPPMQSCFSDLVCQPLVTSYVIDAWSVWPCCTPGPWSTSTWCSASDGEYLRRQKRNGQLENTTGSPSQHLSQQGSGGCKRFTAVEIWDCHGSRSAAMVHLNYAMMMMKDAVA